MRAAGLLVLVLLCALYGVGLGVEPLRLPDEVRSAEVARESARGSPFSAPRLDGRPVAKAPLLPWAARCAFDGEGAARPPAWRLRLVPAGFLLAMAAMVFFLGRGWFSSRAGLLAALFVGAAPLALERGRSFTSEGALALGVTVTVGAALLAIRAVSGRRFLSFLGTTALGAAVAFLGSGLTGPVLAFVILGVATFVERGARGLVTLRALSVLAALALGVAIGLAVVLPGLVSAEGGSLAGAFLKGSLSSLVRAPESARAASLLDRFLLPLGLLPALFFAFFAGRGRIHQLAPGGHPELPLLLLVAWAAVPITLAVALAGAAARALVLAALPPLALLAASAVLEPPREGKPARFIQFFWLGLRGLLLLALAALLLLAIPRWEVGAALWDPAGSGKGLFPFGVPLALTALLLLHARLSEEERASPLPQPFATVGAIAVLLLAWRAIWVPSAGDARLDSGAGFVSRLEQTVGRPLDDGVRSHALDESLRAAIAYERGAPLAAIDDGEAARAWLASGPAEARLLVPLAVHQAAQGGMGKLEAEVRTPLGRVAILRPEGASAPSPPPATATGTATPR